MKHIRMIGATPFYGTTRGSQVVPYNWSCQIRLAANFGGRLKRWEYHGNLGGCGPVIQRLNRYVKAH